MTCNLHFDFKKMMAVMAFIAAVAFSMLGMLTPPPGELSDSNLYLIAQFLLVACSLLGVDAIVTNKGNSR